jgi:hypothetical protein
MIPTVITAAIVSEDVIRPSARPPSAWDLVNVSPRVAPSGRVKTYADQKSALGIPSLHGDTLAPPTGEVGESARAEKPGIPGCLGRERQCFHASCIWPTFYVDLANHGLRPSAPSNPVDPIQPQIGVRR